MKIFTMSMILNTFKHRKYADKKELHDMELIGILLLKQTSE